MTFYKFILQAVGSRTPMGHLARTIENTEDFPKRAKNYKTIHSYLKSKGTCHDTMDIFDDAYGHYVYFK